MLNIIQKLVRTHQSKSELSFIGRVSENELQIENRWITIQIC